MVSVRATVGLFAAVGVVAWSCAIRVWHVGWRPELTEAEVLRATWPQVVVIIAVAGVALWCFKEG